VSASEYKRRLLTAMHDVLAPRGFRKSGSTFRRPLSDVVQLVQLQSSTKSTAERLVATVNLAVFSTALEARLGVPVPSPSVPGAHWRERIGHLAPAQDDLWWEVTRPAEAAAAAAELAALLRDVGLPALEGLDSTERLRALWEAGWSPGLTEGQRRRYLDALSRLAGNRDPVT
jgi:hypothetical protein